MAEPDVLGLKNLDSAEWLMRNFKAAIKRPQEAALVLLGLTQQRNRDLGTGANYTHGFFKHQWDDQH
ncbi:hypothetical protein VP01_4270g1, partial [Puccinia sorghi]